MKKESRIPIDARLAQAVERGVTIHRKLTKAEGGGLSTKNAARQLGISETALLNRHKNGRLAAWRENSQRAFRFPAWQFRDGQVVAGLERVLRVLNVGTRLDEYGPMLFFLSQSRLLEGKRPLDCLRQGEIEKVIQAARGYCQQ